MGYPSKLDIEIEVKYNGNLVERLFVRYNSLLVVGYHVAKCA